MPMKINVGLTKKIGLPDYGSLGASCNVEFEADQSLLANRRESPPHTSSKPTLPVPRPSTMNWPDNKARPTATERPAASVLRGPAKRPVRPTGMAATVTGTATVTVA